MNSLFDFCFDYISQRYDQFQGNFSNLSKNLKLEFYYSKHLDNIAGNIITKKKLKEIQYLDLEISSISLKYLSKKKKLQHIDNNDKRINFVNDCKDIALFKKSIYYNDRSDCEDEHYYEKKFVFIIYNNSSNYKLIKIKNELYEGNLRGNNDRIIQKTSSKYCMVDIDSDLERIKNWINLIKKSPYLDGKIKN